MCKLIGKRESVGKVVYLSVIDPTPWQIDRLLEVAVSLTVKIYECHGIERKVCALGINKEDCSDVMKVVEAEGIRVLTEEDFKR